MAKKKALTFKPAADKLLILVDKGMEQTAGGLIIPEMVRNKSTKGTVVALGPGRMENGIRVPMDVKVGDVVYFSPGASESIVLDEVEYLIKKETALNGKD